MSRDPGTGPHRPDELTAYAAARWEPLVRCFLLLGPTPGQAARLAVDVLARLRLDWPRRADWDERDPDQHLAALVGRVWSETGPGWWRTGSGADEVAELDALPGAERLAVAIEHGLRVDAGAPASPPGLAAALAWLTTVAVAPLDPAAVESRAAVRRRQARRRRTASLLAAGAAVAIVAPLAVVAVREAAVNQPGTVVASPNPSPVVWWADDRLHLRRGIVSVPDVVALAPVSGGAVVADPEGVLRLVTEEGDIEVVARAAPGARVVVAERSSLLAFVDVRPGGLRLVVVDLLADEQPVRRTVAQGTRVVAISDDAVYFADSDGFGRSAVTGGTTYELSAGLDDAAADARVFVRDDGLLVRSTAGDDFTVAGATRGRISDDGAYVLASSPADADSSIVGPQVWDVATGERAEVDLLEAVGAGEVLAASFTESDDVRGGDAVTLLTRGGADEAATYVLTSCALPAGPCTADDTLTGLDSPPLLPAG